VGSYLDAIEFVWDENAERRHLNSGQRATAELKRQDLVAEYAEHVEKLKADAKERQREGGKTAGRGRAKKVSQQIDEPIDHNASRTDAILAKSAGTNRQYIADARPMPESPAAIAGHTHTESIAVPSMI